MSKERNAVLAELMGWEFKERKSSDSSIATDYWRKESYGSILIREAPPTYDTDHNAMAEVWKVLKEKGLWSEFYRTWDVEIDNCHTLSAPAVFYRFLTDPQSQIEAAVKVIKEEKDG